MKFIIILFLINIPFFSAYDNPTSLPSNFPFSTKKDNTKSIIFMKDSITIFDVTKTIDALEPLEEHVLQTATETNICPSGKEKGGIYLDEYYYTSCLNRDNDYQFQIKIFDNNFELFKTFPSDDDYYSFTSGSIRFFKKDTSPELIGVAWINNGHFHIVELNHNEIKIYRHYPVSNMARDIDCIFITKYSRIVCLFGIEINDQYTCSANIFTYDEGDENIFSSNLKTWYICTNHQSRKIRANTDKNGETDIFYYYFVDTNYDAYILPMQLINRVSIEPGPVLRVMTGCDENQHSFDMAEDRFMGYNVFICVENRFKKRIKIQLFKIENNQIIFYENRSLDNPYVFNDGFNSEISMINFIVLKDTLNFGFLSYRTVYSDKAYYTIFNQPECNNFEISMMDEDLYQNKYTILNFNEVIKNDNYDGGIVEIVSYNKGMELTVIDPGTKVKFVSKDYITGNLEFIFRIRNAYYASQPCTAKVKVNDCFKNCKTCSINSVNFFNQLCEGCKPGNYPIINFPKFNNDNCCQKDVDCPDYLYLNTNQYEICDISCLACNGGSEKNCITCYNQVELNKYSSIEINYINEIKHETISTWFYWENTEHKKCLNRDNELYIYLDEETLTYMPCYKSCEKCRGAGTSTNHNCNRCNENSNYFHYENKESTNCFNKDEVAHNYFRYEDEYVAGEIEQSRFWKKCYSLCYSCIGGNNNDCTKCATDSYPKCSEKNLYNYECYNSLPESNYYFDINNKCYEECDINCLTCDKGPELSINNCLSCRDGEILFNRNCYDNCPQTHYELDHKKCVLECPEYAPFKLTYSGYSNEYKQCYNCAEIDKCIYLGSKKTDSSLKGDCISCDLDQTFISNDDYGILDDCYDLCDTCNQRGNVTKMNCDTCKNPDHCLVKDFWNCVERGVKVDYYFMDTEDGKCVYNKCYESCKSCSGTGNVLNHNCLSCRENFQFDPNNPGNCVEICKYYWYIDPNTNKFSCTKEAKCPNNLPLLVMLNNQCVSNCIYAYYSGDYLLYKYKNTCLVQCPENTMKDNLLLSCYYLDNVEEVFYYVTNYISQSELVNNLLIYNSDKTMYFHLFNTTEKGIETYQNTSNNVGTSIIDFSNCISILTQNYGYNNDEVFYIGVLDVIRNDTSAPQFEYIIHNHLGLKLSNDHCIDKEIIINKSLLHNNDSFLAKDILEKYDFDIIDYNKDNPFFCDICMSFDYSHLDPYDVLLNDRYTYYYDNLDYYFCEETCNSEMTNVDLNNSRVQCICQGKNNFTNYNEQNFLKFEKSSKKCTDWFLQYIKCSQNLFKNNIGNFFILVFILFQIFTLLIFFLQSRKQIKTYIIEFLLKKNKIKLKDNTSTEKKDSKKSQTQSSKNSEIISISKNESSKENESNKSNSNNEDESSNSNNNEIESISKSESKTENESEKSEEKSNSISVEASSEMISSKASKTSKENNDYDSDVNSGSKNNISNPPKNGKNKNNFFYNEENKKNPIVENKGAPKPLYQLYAKRFLKNRKDYVDDSYREDSYDFDISKMPKKNKKENEENNEEEEGEEKEKEDNNEENEGDEKDKNNEKEKNDSKKKKKELSPEEIKAKKELEELKEEIRRFKKLSFMELYCLIIKKRHRIISLFIKKDVYDNFAIKLSKLILSYTIDFFITTFLFFDYEIRYLFHSKKHIDPIFMLYMGLLCILLSTTLMRVVDFLMEYRKNFKKAEKEKYDNRKEYFNTLNQMVKNLTKKVIIYFIIVFVFSIIAWYIISTFIGTYLYVNLIWGIMIGINVAVSNIFPFIYYLIGASIQYKAVHNKRYTLYKFAMVILKL